VTRPDPNFTSGLQSGFSLIELLIVLAMVFVVTGFMVAEIVQARQNMTRGSVALEFLSYVEKARADSVRRHPDNEQQMAQISILNKNYYSVLLDSNRDGRLDAPRVISFPAGSNLAFNGPFPRVISFDWRGMTVDADNGVVAPLPVVISNKYGASTVRVTSSGQASLDRNN
jgi:prepilin-type N-terminal cleavage/methylation domain-containing protein